MSDARFLTRCTTRRVVRNLFEVLRHEAIVVKIKFMGARMLYAKVDRLHFSPYFYSQNNKEDVWQTKKQRRNQKAPHEHLRLDV